MSKYTTQSQRVAVLSGRVLTPATFGVGFGREFFITPHGTPAHTRRQPVALLFPPSPKRAIGVSNNLAKISLLGEGEIA